MPRTETMSRTDRRSLLKRAIGGAIGVTAASTFPTRWTRGSAGLGTAYAKTQVELPESLIVDFEKSMRGAVIRPSSPEYDTARRVWNAVIDRYPALVARCTSVEDIQTALQFAREHDLLTAMRCGAHNYGGTGTCDGGMVLDLSPFAGADIDVKEKVAYVKGGSGLGELDRASVPHGLATTAGVVSHTGIGGLATGGGQGRLGRKHGLTVDNILGVDIVTADGRLLHASSSENADLYWAVRGGGGNFGIVTTFKLQLHDFDPTITSFSYTFGAEHIPTVMSAFFDFAPTAPRELSASVGVRTSDNGEITCSISGTYIGKPDVAEKIVAPLQKLAPVLRTRFEGSEYVKLQSIVDGPKLSKGGTYMRAGMFNRVDPTQLISAVKEAAALKGPGLSIGFSSQAGAINDVAADATAFPHRDALYQCVVSTNWTDLSQTETQQEHVRQTWSILKPMSTGGVYVNCINDETPEDVRTSFLGSWNRLVAVKTKYDPGNFFRVNVNIPPRQA
ncbi:MAG: FAD-binding protein [Rhodobacteraceae bacterium]|nr:FAD-binding protein [Paracoccaceae bacterium]